MVFFPAVPLRTCVNFQVGDLLILKEGRWEHLVYQLGDNAAVQFVVKNGSIVYTRTD